MSLCFAVFRFSKMSNCLGFLPLPAFSPLLSLIHPYGPSLAYNPPLRRLTPPGKVTGWLMVFLGCFRVRLPAVRPPPPNRAPIRPGDSAPPPPPKDLPPPCLGPRVALLTHPLLVQHVLCPWLPEKGRGGDESLPSCRRTCSF